MQLTRSPYVKFLKDLTTVKRKISVPREATIVAQASCLIQQIIAPKYKISKSPIYNFSYDRDKIIDRCLLDLEAGVNFLPYPVYKQLGLGELQLAKLILLSANRSVKILKKIIEDIILKVDEFYFPIDFVVLDTKPLMNHISHSPVILGRLFLATADAVIRCRKGAMTLSFGNNRQAKYFSH